MKKLIMDNSKILVANMVKMTLQAQKDMLLNPKNITRMLTLLRRLQQSFRLMVGVPDYPTYLDHMRNHHPDLEPMDEKTFFRYCVDARYPGKGGLKRCTC